MQPERIGRYQIIRELGRGGFATVYLGEDRGLDDLVAIKVLADFHAADDDGVQRFVAEARVMRNLRTPGVVTVHDVGEHNGCPYFVMEFCERGSLEDRLTSLGRALTIEEGFGLATAIAKAMDGLHGADPPVVHRDLKPGNLLIRHTPNTPQTAVGELLGTDEELIVGDFGLAKVVEADSTKRSLIAYTRGFAPPEQIRGEGSIGPSADVFSASAVIVSALSGETPRQVFDDTDLPFSDEAFARTGPMRSTLEQGLQFERSERHDTLRTWSSALTDRGANPAAAPPVAVTPTAPLAETSSVSTTPRRRSVGAPGGAVGMLVAGLLAVGLLVVGVTVAILATRGGGPAIVGPDAAQVGDELAFAVFDTEVEQWRVGTTISTDEILILEPQSAGRITITATTAEGTSDLAVDIATEGRLRIVGPGLLPMGQVTTLAAAGADGSLTWTVGSATSSDETLQLSPTRPGTTTIVLETSGGQRVERTFTVPAPR